jgi:hypothetical protein
MLYSLHSHRFRDTSIRSNPHRWTCRRDRTHPRTSADDTANSSAYQPKDREFDDMREELQDIKRQLAEQNGERNAQKQNGPSKQKTPVIP